MTDLTAKLLALFKSIDTHKLLNLSILDSDTFNGDELSWLCERNTPNSNFTMTQVDHWGGEDQGSDYGYVFKITAYDSTFYLKTTGHYSSWDTTEWNAYEIVTPRERQITTIDWIENYSDPLENHPELLI